MKVETHLDTKDTRKHQFCNNKNRTSGFAVILISILLIALDSNNQTCSFFLIVHLTFSMNATAVDVWVCNMDCRECLTSITASTYLKLRFAVQIVGATSWLLWTLWVSCLIFSFGELLRNNFFLITANKMVTDKDLWKLFYFKNRRLRHISQ